MKKTDMIIISIIIGVSLLLCIVAHIRNKIINYLCDEHGHDYKEVTKSIMVNYKPDSVFDRCVGYDCDADFLICKRCGYTIEEPKNHRNYHGYTSISLPSEEMKTLRNRGWIYN
ncbi:MAG: hypothetical protein ABFD76_11825 [Smithella sp.]